MSAAQWALSKAGCAYSQEKRTQESAFDCSSLVARAYAAQGKQWKYGGNVPRSNQEVYDDDFELLWPEDYAVIGKRFGGKEVIHLAKKAGDLQFLCTDSKTSRANKITHVAMVASESQIVHARGKAYGVCVNALDHYSGKVCAVTRYNPICALRVGMKGFRTLAVQHALNRHGAIFTEDGEFGSNTAKAVRHFQQQKGLPITGQAERATLALLIQQTIRTENDRPADVGEKVRISGATVNVRTGPGTEYPSAKIARQGEAYEAVNTDEWVPVRIGGEIFWISRKYCSMAI